MRQPGAWNDQPRPLAAFLRGCVADRKVERLFTQRAENGMSDARAKALRECNAEAGKMTQSTSASIELDMHRAGMMQHGMERE